MSEYRSFERCVICRTLTNLKNYCGDFEETLLINSLYMAVMFPFEKRQHLHVKTKRIVQYLDARNIVDRHGNDFSCDDVIRYLRNSLAHYNIEVENDLGYISRVRLWGKNPPPKALCKSPCEKPLCIPEQFQANENGEICTFDFSTSELREFTIFVIQSVLEILTDDICQSCKYHA